ncbi:hypothetical protein [Helicobacter bizzozeronii]|uniref:hypothetical protein n=1 Tax=Helicobacter bizzozeronii TaxID=56877 RepID=UPI000CEE90FF|nr:hypothetical protein [Helicobacter bizzozeronii]
MSEKKDLGNYLRNAERGAVVYCDIAHTGFMGKLKHIGGKATFEHSGIYIGEVDGQHLIAEIVDDNGEAKVRYTDSHRFMARLNEEPKKEGKIYIACDKNDKNRTLCDEKVYERATKDVIGNQKLVPHRLYDLDYFEELQAEKAKQKEKAKSKEGSACNLTYDPMPDVNLFSNPKDRTNCHKFVQYCLVGEFKDKYGSFEMLEDNITSELGAFKWVGMPIKS